jgi:hypothetical protein
MLRFETKHGKKKGSGISRMQHTRWAWQGNETVVGTHCFLFVSAWCKFIIHIWVTYVMRCGVRWCSCCFLALTKSWRLLQLKRYLVPCRWRSHVMVRRKKQIYFFFCLKINLLHVVFGAKHGELLFYFILFFIFYFYA